MSDHTQKSIFREIVKMGLACDLVTPQEWIQNYEMHFINWTSYMDLEVIQGFITLVEREFIAITKCVMDSEVTPEMRDEWYKEIYGDRWSSEGLTV